MAKRMLINVREEEESRIAIIDGEYLAEIYIERTSSLGHVGNIYKGRVANVEPSIQAAFVDIGEGRNGFLHVSDIMPIYGEMSNEHEIHNNKRRDKRIQDILQRNAEVLVQITKEGIGSKAPTLTTYLSIPGRYIVLMPSIKRSGVSRKIEDENLRRKLKSTLAELSPPSGMGYIIRTAGADKSKKDLARDLEYLLNLWKVIVKRTKHSFSPSLIYQESDLVIRTLRDIFTEDIEKILIDNPEAYQKAKNFMKLICPEHEKRVYFYDDDKPLFYKYKIENSIEDIYKKCVSLKSGGHIIIEQTEALVSIDVNSGKYTDEKDIEKTALKINMEAAFEIARQLRLRDLGGLIINDFIDMKDPKNKRSVERAFREAIKKDRARSRIGRISQFGIIEMTRQRLGPSIKTYTHDVCPICRGQGWIKNLESMSLDIMRKIKLGALSHELSRIQVRVNPRLALDLTNRKRKDINRLEIETGVKILINPDDTFLIEKTIVDFYDKRGNLINL